MSPSSAPFYPRLGILATVFATVIAVLGLRLAWLSTAQAVDVGGASWTQIPAPRGSLWDRQGELLATNAFVYEVGLDLAAAERWADLPELSQQASSALGLPAGELVDRMGRALEAYRADPGAPRWIRLATEVPMQHSDSLEPLVDMGVTLKRIPRRVYPLGADMAHLTGFIYEHHDPDAEPSAAGEEPELRGSGGIEASYDEQLAGIDGQLAGYFGTRPGDFRPARAGSDLRLTIDRDIQVAAAQALARTVEAQDAEGGSVVVLDPRTGALLASTSLPSFDPQNRGDAAAESFADPAVSAIYEPGSVIKAVTLAAAIAAGAVEATSHYQDEGSIEYAGLTIQNWDHLGHGWISMREMMVNSLNVGAVWAASQLGRDGFYAAMTDFGYGRVTGIDLVGEVPGILHRPEDEGDAWYAGNLATNAFGQGMSATPLQVAVSIATIANDGLAMQPHVVAEQIPVGGLPLRIEPRATGQVIRPETARSLRALMQAVVDDKATQAAIPGYSVGGKTGTSQIAIPGGYDEEGTIASFAGFLPVDEPRVVILAKVDRPEAIRGSDVAAPLFREVAEAAIAALDIPPDQPLGGYGSQR